MKKPNITKGEWAQQKYKHGSVLDIISKPKGEIVCELQYFGTDTKEQQANAKAISAVPEMIDELDKSTDLLYELLGIVVDSKAVEMLKEQIKRNEKALKKAGCTDE